MNKLFKNLTKDTPAIVAIWTSLITVLAAILPTAIETMPDLANPVINAWVKWICGIIILVCQYFNITSGKTPNISKNKNNV